MPLSPFPRWPCESRAGKPRARKPSACPRATCKIARTRRRPVPTLKTHFRVVETPLDPVAAPSVFSSGQARRPGLGFSPDAGIRDSQGADLALGAVRGARAGLAVVRRLHAVGDPGSH